MHKIVHCQAPDVPFVARMLARAFLEDPLYQFIFPGLPTREAHTAWDMAGLIRYGMRFGEAAVTSDLAGCAVWLPPGETDFTEERMGQAGMLDAARIIGEAAEARMSLFVEASELVHRRIAPSSHWYLVVLGVEPDHQGQGIGSSLMAGPLKRADEAGLPAYLETLKAGNLPFYERRGFSLRHQEALPDGGPMVWYMVRDPVHGRP